MTSLVSRLLQTASLPVEPARPGHPKASGFPSGGTEMGCRHSIALVVLNIRK